MGKNRTVFLDAGVDPCDKTNGIIGHSVGRGVEPQAVVHVQVLVHRVHGIHAPLAGRRTRQHRPHIALQVHPALGIGVGANLPSVRRNAPQIPAPPHSIFSQVSMTACHIAS